MKKDIPGQSLMHTDCTCTYTHEKTHIHSKYHPSLIHSVYIVHVKIIHGTQETPQITSLC